ncbi:MAG: aldo/keto reductase, partial [Nitrososphaerales archaeon]
MEYVNFGKTGLNVSKICLGCMSLGKQSDWMVDGENANRVLKRAWDLGINFFDTANVYSMGRSEETVGEFLTGIDREDAVVATKVYGVMGDGANQNGLSRKHVAWQIRESLKRLKTDYVDLYQIHRWDYKT